MRQTQRDHIMPNTKPKACLICPGSHSRDSKYYVKTTGFVPTDVSLPVRNIRMDLNLYDNTRLGIQSKKMALVAEAAGEQEALKSIPLCGSTGIQLEERVLKPLGLSRADVIMDNLIRCRPENNEFPKGEKARLMIESCRTWNTIIDIYDPNVVIFAFHPTFALIYSPNQAYSTYNAVRKALMLKEHGYRPLVAMGERFMKAYFAELPGSITDWDGKHFFIKWQRFGFHSLNIYNENLDDRQKPRRVKVRL